MARLRTNNVFGTITNNPLLVGGTTLSGAGLANLVAVTGSDVAVITLDPNRVNGPPEIVYVTAHTALSTSATILRGQEGTVARQHPNGTFWVHGATALDAERVWDPPACRVTHNAAQSIANAAWVALIFNTEAYDTDAMHSTVSNTSRITINTAGIYVVSAGVFWAANGAGRRGISIGHNGAPSTQGGATFVDAVGAVHATMVNVTIQQKFAAGTFIEAFVYQDSGGALNSTASDGDPFFAATLVGTGD